ncbi:hypothetical protein PHYPO_G00088280 [Pangasianodon hypophthalmus]|uniref:Sushi domain-containing protein n=1 Tax=Pangasianodon hypophthalmus TaxID=310915 RepID=A0A5N5LHJ8_PANHP|nr:hypothetical protein PHYPO_G00088280 [Pangasianodon hypophthalmus]
MRAATLTFLFIISEYSTITGGDGNCGAPPEIANAEKVKNITSPKFRMTCKEGYLRAAGTSSLFKCRNNSWDNSPPLVCKRRPLPPNVTQLIHTSSSTVTPSMSSPTPKTYNVTASPGKHTSTTSGKIVFTATHTASTTSWTSRQTSQRTTTMEETSVTTSITARITASSTTEKENMITMSSHSSSSFSPTSTGDIGALSNTATKGITAGILIVVIIAGLAATVAVLFWRRRSKLPGGHSVEMMTQNSGSDQPLMKPHTFTSSCPPDPVTPPVTPYKDSSGSTYINAPLSA